MMGLGITAGNGEPSRGLGLEGW